MRGGGGVNNLSLNASTRFSQKVALSIACISCLTLTDLHARWYIRFGDETKANCNVEARNGNFIIEPKSGGAPCQGDSARFSTDGGWGKTLILDRVTLDSFRADTENAGIDASRLWGNVRLNNSHIGTANIEGKLKVEIVVQRGTTNTINTLNHTASLLHLKGDNGKLDIKTFNQTGANSDTQVFGKVTITDFNLSGGKAHQLAGDITNLNITNGTFYQGKHNGDPSGYSDSQITGGTITKVDLSGNGAFEQIRGSVTDFNQSGGTLDQRDGTISTLNQSGGQAIQQGGTITNLNLSGGTFAHNGGTLTSITLKGGGSGSTFINGSSTAIATINQEGGNHAVAGKITDFNLKGGSVSNKGEITNLNLTSANATLHNSGVITNLISGTTTTTKAFRATANKHISNAGTIDKLELNEATNVTNSGTIKELNVNKGNSTINTLTGVAQNPDTKLSNINIKANDAKLTVDTLSVGLDGNNAIKRVEINGNTGGNGGGKEFAVNKIQVSYINGTFDPTQNISNQLKDYVSNGVSQSYIDGNSKPTFEASPELEGGPGIKFNPDGTPYFDPQDSISASMTSMILRQSLRRKNAPRYLPSRAKQKKP
ncbi:hypothetical protein Hc94105_1213 [Helicobacter cinaedi]|uniref:autotransporter adhesin family protein n=1 Tax=Helicobacter cinaedi TaxID=213 RepID=UPI001F3AD652|nr:autotransporter adhesin family protein [Helicobacter cinaedi]BDB67010.1 hypothetical protein Hc94105_1213 [Helicobacter cinaedi]